MPRDPLDVIAEICHDQPPDALTKIASALGFGPEPEGTFQPIGTAPKDGSAIGVWSPRKPGLIQIVRWGLHLGIKKHDPCWITVTRDLAIANVPTHWIALGPLPGAAGVTGTDHQTFPR